MSDPALLSSHPGDGIRIGQQEPQGPGPYRATVAGIGRWSSRAGLVHSLENTKGCRPGARSRSHIAGLAEQLRQAMGVVFGIPAASLPKAQEQLAGKLGVVAVLAERIMRGGALAGLAAAEPLVNVRSGDIRGLGFHHKSQRVAQGLAEQGPRQAVSPIQRPAPRPVRSAYTPGRAPGFSRRSRDIPARSWSCLSKWLAMPMRWPVHPAAPPGPQPDSGSAGGTPADPLSGESL